LLFCFVATFFICITGFGNLNASEPILESPLPDNQYDRLYIPDHRGTSSCGKEWGLLHMAGYLSGLFLPPGYEHIHSLVLRTDEEGNVKEMGWWNPNGEDELGLHIVFPEPITLEELEDTEFNCTDTNYTCPFYIEARFYLGSAICISRLPWYQIRIETVEGGWNITMAAFGKSARPTIDEYCNPPWDTPPDEPTGVDSINSSIFGCYMGPFSVEVAP